jgi:hypothetical protein
MYKSIRSVALDYVSIGVNRLFEELCDNMDITTIFTDATQSNIVSLVSFEMFPGAKIEYERNLAAINDHSVDMPQDCCAGGD